MRPLASHPIADPGERGSLEPRRSRRNTPTMQITQTAVGPRLRLDKRGARLAYRLR